VLRTAVVIVVVMVEGMEIVGVMMAVAGEVFKIIYHIKNTKKQIMHHTIKHKITCILRRLLF